MIDLTRFNGTGFTVNCDLIETIEETPDTVVTLTTGKKIIVKESRHQGMQSIRTSSLQILSSMLSMKQKRRA